MNATNLQEFDALKAKVTLFVEPTRQLKVVDAATSAVATGVLKTIKAMMGEVEARRLAATKPLLDRKKEIDNYAKEIGQPLDDAETFVKKQIAEFAAADRKLRQEQEQKLEADRAAKEKAAAKERAKLEAEAKAKRDAEEKARREKEEAERAALAEQQASAAKARAIFGAGPNDQAKQDAEAKALSDRQEQERHAAQKAAEEERLAMRARLDREAAERERSAAAERKRLEAERPKNVRQVPKFELSDAALVPAEFLVVDLTLLGVAIRGGRRDIPGVRIWMEDVVVAR